MLQSCLMPLTHQPTAIWLENHFDIYGDKAPNKEEIQLSVNLKKEVFEIYVREMTCSQFEPILQYNVFVNVLNSLFPHVKSRP